MQTALLTKPRGRKTVLTPKRREHILQLMSQGTSRNRAARLIGCAPSTITYGALRDPAFGQALARARALHLQRLSRTMLEAAGCSEKSAQPKFSFKPHKDYEHAREQHARPAPPLKKQSPHPRKELRPPSKPFDDTFKQQLHEQALRDPSLLRKLTDLIKQADRFMSPDSSPLADEIAEDFFRGRT